ncbi:MAG: riboflavin synthase subunit alpha [Gammaproteobacteria bacterium]|nr:riboflavin synthase subunit alpha [Gammaproteobacteria bacterium]
MFTGIVQALIPIADIVIESGVQRLGLSLGALAEGLQPGASVAINGTCLTVVQTSGNFTTFDVIEETRRLTNLGGFKPGTLVNVERSLRIGDEVGGHIVSGHVTGTATVSRVESREGVRDVVFAGDAEWMKFLLHKGFVALDGASLTIASVDQKACEFTVCLIPETIERTTLGRINGGDKVNVEVDSQTRATIETVERLFTEPAWLESLRSRL